MEELNKILHQMPFSAGMAHTKQSSNGNYDYYHKEGSEFFLHKCISILG